MKHKKYNPLLDVYQMDEEHSLIKRIRLFFKRKQFAKERARKGYCRWDIWDLDTFFSALIVDALKEFIKHDQRCPTDVFSELTEEEAHEKWHKILQEIIDDFEFYLSDDNEAWDKLNSYLIIKESIVGHRELETTEEKLLRQDFYNEEIRLQEEKKKRLKHGFDLLSTYFTKLWW